MNKRVSPIGKADGTTFENLAERVKNVHNATSSVAKGAVNQLLTIRNWAIGCYIVEYEQDGCDRAKYGARLLQNLADKLSWSAATLQFQDSSPTCSRTRRSLLHTSRAGKRSRQVSSQMHSQGSTPTSRRPQSLSKTTLPAGRRSAGTIPKSRH